jgi:hypothetical protein
MSLAELFAVPEAELRARLQTLRTTARLICGPREGRNETGTRSRPRGRGAHLGKSLAFLGPLQSIAGWAGAAPLSQGG